MAPLVLDRSALLLLFVSALVLSHHALPWYIAVSDWRAQTARVGDDPAPRLASRRRLPRFSPADVAALADGDAVWNAPFILEGLCGGGDGDGDVCPTLSRFNATPPAALPALFPPTSFVTHYPANMDPKRRIRPVPHTPWPAALSSLLGLPPPSWPAAAAAAAAAALSSLLRAPPAPQVAQWNGLGGGGWDALTAGLPPLPGLLGRTRAWLPANASLADALVTRAHWRLLVAGSPGSGMFNHVDELPAGSWQLQLRGSKWWHLCSPEASRQVRDVPQQADRFFDSHVGLDMLRLHEEGRREARSRGEAAAGSSACWADVVHPGELIYYPARYWHQTLNVPPAGDVAIALSESVVPPSGWDRRELAERWRARMAGAGHWSGVVAPDVEAALTGMRAAWDEAWGAWDGVQPETERCEG